MSGTLLFTSLMFSATAVQSILVRHFAQHDYFKPHKLAQTNIFNQSVI